MADEVEAAVVRKTRKTALKRKKARAQAKKMEAVDVALQTSLAETPRALAEEMASFGLSKTSLRTYLLDQYRSRLLLHNGIYNTTDNFRISIDSEALQTADESTFYQWEQNNY